MLLPALAQAQFTFITNADNTITITGYTGVGGNVVIPSTTNGYTVTSIGCIAFDSCTNLTSVIIPDTVTNIGQGAFAYCSNLTSVTMTNSIAWIGVQAFQNCTSLTNVTIPDSIGGIGDSTFLNCSSLTSVNIPENVRSIGQFAFADCGLTNVTISGRLILIGSYAFSCPNLTAAYFQGNAPNDDGTVFLGCNATVYYLPGTTFWHATFGSCQTAFWSLPYPVILTSANGSIFGFRGTQTKWFYFVISWATNIPVVVEASTNLGSPVWTPITTNALVNGRYPFSDFNWTNYPSRFYRVRSQ